ncbi:MAG: hypothetical protein ACF8XB_07150 [Planctomycetota bacterium JB042]
MAALGEDVAPEVVPEYDEGLFRTGEAAAARAFVVEHAEHWDDRVERAIEVLERHAPTDRRLYGRAQALRKHLPRE